MLWPDTKLCKEFDDIFVLASVVCFHSSWLVVTTSFHLQQTLVHLIFVLALQKLNILVRTSQGSVNVKSSLLFVDCSITFFFILGCKLAILFICFCCLRTDLTSGMTILAGLFSWCEVLKDLVLVRRQGSSVIVKLVSFALGSGDISPRIPKSS